MIKGLLKLLLISGGLLVIGYAIPGVAVASFSAALLTAVIFGLINVSIKPILKLLTLPLNIITFGLFSLVVNGIIFWWVGTLINGFTVDNFVAAFIGSLVLSLFIGVIRKI